MSDRRRPIPDEHKDIIAAFDREREEAHELSRRHLEIINNARRNDRPYRHDDEDGER